MKYEIEIESMEDGNCICYFYINGEKKKFEEMNKKLQLTLFINVLTFLWKQPSTMIINTLANSNGNAANFDVKIFPDKLYI